MRIKSHWFKSERNKTPQEIAGAVAFVIWRIADNALKNTRQAKFEINIGMQYFSFLGEFLVFLIQVADRIAYRKMPIEARMAFTTTLANRVAETFAENQCRLLGDELRECKQRFIDKINQRAGEYAEFGYNENGPDFAFMRYLAYCIGQDMGERDSIWITDQMMSVEAPAAVRMMEKTLRDLYEVEPHQTRRRLTVSGD